MQIEELMDDENLPFNSTLTVNVADSSFSIASFLGKTCDLENLVTVTRSRGNRVYFHLPDSSPVQSSKGRPKCFGERFDMKNSKTWGDANQTIDYPFQRPSGKPVTIKIEAWSNLLMRGKRGLPMHQHPFTLIRARMLNEDGAPVFKRPLWLIVIGKRKNEISSIDAWLCYRQRYDLEHFYRFGKRKLLMGTDQLALPFQFQGRHDGAMLT